MYINIINGTGVPKKNPIIIMMMKLQPLTKSS